MPIDTQALQAEFLTLLNSLVKKEPVALYDLIEFRVPVRRTFLSASEPVVVLVDDEGKNPRLGALGLVNSVLGPHKIAAVFEVDHEGDEVLVRFEPADRKSDFDDHGNGRTLYGATP